MGSANRKLQVPNKSDTVTETKKPKLFKRNRNFLFLDELDETTLTDIIGTAINKKRKFIYIESRQNPYKLAYVIEQFLENDYYLLSYHTQTINNGYHAVLIYKKCAPSFTSQNYL